MATERQLCVIEFVLWVGTVATLTVSISLILGFAIGGGLLTAKYAMFVLGFILAGFGSIGLQPERPHKEEKPLNLDTSQNRLEVRIQELPPLQDEHLRFERRIGRAPKLFVTGLVVLGVSLLLEFGFGVAVGPTKSLI